MTTKFFWFKCFSFSIFFISLFTLFTLATSSPVSAQQITDTDSPGFGCDIDPDSHPACSSIEVGELGFQIPTLGDILTFAIRAFFVIAGLAALFYMLIGAFAWVTSGGDKEAVGAARDKIQSAVVGMILIVAVLAVIWTLEQVVFKRRICMGLSCPLTLPGLIESAGDDYCCACVVNEVDPAVANQPSRGELFWVVNTSRARCMPNGTAIGM